jgi:hypothetical protein
LASKKTVDIADLLVPETQDELDLQAFLEDVGTSTSSVDLYRVRRDGGKSYKARLLFQDLKENAMEYIRTEYGGGKWLLSFRDAGGRIKGNKLVEIEEDKETQPVTTITTQPVDHLQFMREQMAMQQNLITALIANSNKGNGLDMGQLLTGMAAMMTAMTGGHKPDVDIGMILNALKPTDPSVMLGAMVNVFAAMKGTTKDDDWIEKTSKLVGLAKEISGDGNNGSNGAGADSMWGVVSEVGKHVADRFLPNVLASGGPRQIPASTTVQPGDHSMVSRMPVGGNDPEKNAETESQDAGRERMMQWIKAGLTYLKSKAQMGKDPLIYVDLIMDNQEEPQWQALLYVLNQGASFENLLTFDPEIAENPALAAWFKVVYDGLKDSDDPDSGGAAGDTTDTSSNEVVGPVGPKSSTDKIPSEDTPKS